MKTVKVTFADGNSLITGINGSKAEIQSYYLNNTFQFGDTEVKPFDDLQVGVNVEFLETDEERAQPQTTSEKH